jgi:hypothetical protein
VSRSVAILPNPSVLTTVGCLEKRNELAMVTQIPHGLIRILIGIDVQRSSVQR